MVETHPIDRLDLLSNSGVLAGSDANKSIRNVRDSAKNKPAFERDCLRRFQSGGVPKSMFLRANKRFKNGEINDSDPKNHPSHH